ncbi:hypothetical protein FY036_06810 [Mesorhizobium microcysteis]|uniref:Uncharacterized protein n=1 Tax=Neoaquamicrobium microcysteis TaxID=2682781 RepID=A0A5D4GZM2_9HYPH|nr:hypothetical protein FY036_06810 [Mesorhizobium microcysteis]
MHQSRPANPTDPGDAADLSIMGCLHERMGTFPPPVLPMATVAQHRRKINSFLTIRPDSRILG